VVSNNYYKAATGKIVTQWPYGALFYMFLTNVSGRLSSFTGRATGSSRPVEAQFKVESGVPAS
jgi:hypothetical protein